ncbi:MAG: hypothetical protein ACTSU4_01495 [Promethearchaeota archaeon]
MGAQDLEIYNLNYSGAFNKMSSNVAPLELFSLYNILAVYVYNKKKMYIWIGKNVANSLKIYIPNIRALFLEEFPEKKILRNITIESGFETAEFLENFDFSKEELMAHLKKQENKVNPVLSKINEMKEEIEYLIETENYDTAIARVREIIELARAIEDQALVRDQENLIDRIKELKHRKEIDIIARIDELRIVKQNHSQIGNYNNAIQAAREIISLAKSANLELIIREEEEFIARFTGKYDPQKLVIKARETSLKLKKQQEELLANNKIQEAHALVADFIEKYGRFCDLTKIPSAKTVLDKDKITWKDFLETREKMKQELADLEKQYLQAVKLNNARKALTILDTAWNILFSINDDELTRKWAQLEEDSSIISKKREKEEKSELIRELEQSINLNLHELNKEQLKEQSSNFKKYIEFARGNNLDDLLNELSSKNEELLIRINELEKIEQEIMRLEPELKNARNENDFNSAITICESLIALSKQMSSIDLVEKYQELLKAIKNEKESLEKKKIENRQKKQQVEQFKKNIRELNEEGKQFFFQGDLKKSLQTYQKIIALFNDFKKLTIQQ